MRTGNSKIKEILKRGEIHLVLFQGLKEKDNKPFHAFVIMDGQKFEKLKTQESSIVLGEYGKVIYSNSGMDVPEEISEGIIAGFKKRFLEEKI